MRTGSTGRLRFDIDPRADARAYMVALVAAAIVSAAALVGCGRGPDAQAVVDRTIEAHGGRVLDNAVVEFDFRGRHFRATRDDGRFRYERMFTDSTGQVRDVLTNDSLYREVNGGRVQITEQQRRSIERGVNSVIYFALLPYNLNDEAVNKRYLGETTINGAPYHEIEVTFDQEGGGRDYQDRFIYWFNRDTGTMDYLAYSFQENGGGTRFRQAVNPRVVEGVRFADYLNFTSESLGARIEEYETAFQAGRVAPFSEIVLENVQVRRLGD